MRYYVRMEAQLPQMNEIIFACAKGRDRSPEMAASFSGSSYLEGGMESLSKQLNSLPTESEKISFLKRKFNGKRFVIIDKDAFSPIQRLFSDAGIVYSVTDFSDLLQYREGLKSNFHWPGFDSNTRQ